MLNKLFSLMPCEPVYSNSVAAVGLPPAQVADIRRFQNGINQIIRAKQLRLIAPGLALLSSSASIFALIMILKSKKRRFAEQNEEIWTITAIAIPVGITWALAEVLYYKIKKLHRVVNGINHMLKQFNLIYSPFHHQVYIIGAPKAA